MKAKVTRGNGFRGILNYSLGPGKKNKPDRAQIVAGNMAGCTSRELTREFGRVRQLRPDIKNPVWHCSLALPAGELNTAWDAIAEKHLQNMGVDVSKHQWLAVRHSDTDHDHVHIVLNRIALDGTVWHGKRDVFLAIESTQRLEKEFGLKLTPGLEAEPDYPRKSQGQDAKEKRTGQPSAKVRMQKILNQAMKTGRFDAFVQSCEAQGLVLLPNVAKTGKMNGFSFRFAGEVMKASDMGAKYKWAKLAEATCFEPGTHQQIIERLAADERARPRTEAAITMKRSGGEAVALPPKRRRTLDLVFLVDVHGAYCWRKRGTVAFEDLGYRISMRSTSETAIRAALQLAREKGWMEIEVSGSLEFRRAIWAEGMRQGIGVSGYEPPPATRAEFESRSSQKACGWEEALHFAAVELGKARQTLSGRWLFEVDACLKQISLWQEKARTGIDDDFLWEVGHHEVNRGKTAPEAIRAIYMPLYQLRRDDIEARKRVSEAMQDGEATPLEDFHHVPRPR